MFGEFGKDRSHCDAFLPPLSRYVRGQYLEHLAAQVQAELVSQQRQEDPGKPGASQHEYWFSGAGHLGRTIAEFPYGCWFHVFFRLNLPGMNETCSFALASSQSFALFDT